MLCPVLSHEHRFVSVPTVAGAGDGSDDSQRALLGEIDPRIALGDRNHNLEAADSDVALRVDMAVAAVVKAGRLH